MKRPIKRVGQDEPTIPGEKKNGIVSPPGHVRRETRRAFPLLEKRKNERGARERKERGLIYIR